jgi:hypothetical protein
MPITQKVILASLKDDLYFIAIPMQRAKFIRQNQYSPELPQEQLGENEGATHIHPPLTSIVFEQYWALDCASL